MTDFIENKGWVILNGYARGDEEGEYTFIGARGNTVIDYITCSKRERNADSNTVERQIITWGEEDIGEFKAATEVIDCVEEKEEDLVEFSWAILKSAVNKAIKRKSIKIKKWKIGMKRWWDKSCAREKRAVSKALNDWKKGKCPKEIYLKKKKNMETALLGEGKKFQRNGRG